MIFIIKHTISTLMRILWAFEQPKMLFGIELFVCLPLLIAVFIKLLTNRNCRNMDSSRFWLNLNKITAFLKGGLHKRKKVNFIFRLEANLQVCH